MLRHSTGYKLANQGEELIIKHQVEELGDLNEQRDELAPPS